MKRLIAGILVAVLVLVLVTPAVLAKPDMDKPLPATDVELVKKITVHGKPGGGGGGKPAAPAATGTLGANCSGTKYAIIVGISDYPGTANDLQYCDDDAQDIYNALTTLYGYNSSNIHLVLNMTASFDAIRNAISDIESREIAGDEVVFFFSGHGSKGSWTPDDSQDLQQGVDLDGIDESIVAHDGHQLVNIWDGELRDWFAGFNTSRIIFIFDSCLAGGMTDLKAPGRVINMACTEKGVSYEFTGLQNGQFTCYFVDQGMLQSKADIYDSITGVADVTIEEAFDYAKAKCRIQKPTISDSFDDDLPL
jgi:hypothetical protein